MEKSALLPKPEVLYLLTRPQKQDAAHQEIL
jgi:hypothetical protein